MLSNLAASVAEATVAAAEQTGEVPTVYVTHNLLSKVVAGAFAQGCSARMVTLPQIQNNDHYDFQSASRDLVERGFVITEPIAAYGILRGCGELLSIARMMKHDYWHIDNGYVKQSNHERRSPDGSADPDFSGYYRITRNGFQNTDEVKDRPPDRWSATNVGIADKWQKTGKDILVIPPSNMVAQYQKIDQRVWMTQVQAEIKKRTDKPIRVKAFKGGLREILPSVYCVVAHESMALLHSVISGVPALALGEHCLGNLSWTWKDLEYPNYPDRERVRKLCHWLGYQQWTLPEIKSGRAWRMLNDA